MLTLLLFSLLSFADDILCENAPTAQLVEEIHPPRAATSNPCGGHQAKIQGSAYECGSANDVFINTTRFYKGIVEQTKKKCDEYCEEIDKSCKGRLQIPSDCALSIPSTRAIEVGAKVVNCPKHCAKGQAFSYCSLYHANFFSKDPELFKGKSPNCICEQEKPALTDEDIRKR
jgi:hypothetical protein